MTTDRRVLERALTVADGEAPSEPPPERPLGWRAGERALRLATVAAVAAAAALVTGRPWLLALAAGPAVLLALAAPTRHRPTRLDTTVTADPRRCFEGDTITVRIELHHDGEAGLIDPAITLGPGVGLTELRITGSTVNLRLAATRWGRWSLGTVDLDLYDTGGLARRTVRADLGEADIYPIPSQARLTPIPVRLPERLGEHTTRQSGEGVEVVGVRPHIWGERQRRIHWPSTTRRGSIQINQFAAERTADAVVLLDALSDLRDPVTGRSTLDETLRAASGLTRAYLRKHDRVGVVSIGGAIRWLRPGTGDRHFYRIVESVLEVRKDLGYRNPDLHRLPPPALPAGALVYAFTPLADQRILDVLRDLSDRGNPLVVVEIPAGDPHVEADDRIGQHALRLWRADRRAMHFALQNRGIPVVTHVPDESLDLTLAPLLRSRIQGRTR
ncbi:uncharacterized protein (DUF58 family) [Kitasatospora sp. MAA4]|uniref:DUF58 domain-containing protein n=1 Tax=Kitasatospora sp. MAA4 TaxID=3035093 RepID=UPI0024752443|nr:DUF58 domain-containing protein [Kitasatospora sp. MAA4]MDH6136720.1 uncharacterized protein (DUF58 family) [Kitasatospora sp. MAA4]